LSKCPDDRLVSTASVCVVVVSAWGDLCACVCGSDGNVAV